MKLPHRALTDTDLFKYAKVLKIPHFRGVFMRNQLPVKGPRRTESAIVNLDDSHGPGTHWVTYRKIGDSVLYFDSFGNLRPPSDLVDYLGDGSVIKYNHDRYQDYDSVECGHLCLKFLTEQLHIKDKYCLYKSM